MKAPFAIVALLVLVGCLEQSDPESSPAPVVSDPAPEAPEAPVAEGQDTLELAIDGIHCAGCAAGVDRRLRAVEGVSECTVDVETGRAVVVYDPTATDAARLAAASIEGTDFSVKPVQ